MRFSVGFKIFGIAIFLALVMLVASITADLRVRDAVKRVGSLATVLIPLSDRITEVQASALDEEKLIRTLAEDVLRNVRRHAHLVEAAAPPRPDRRSCPGTRRTGGYAVLEAGRVPVEGAVE